MTQQSTAAVSDAQTGAPPGAPLDFDAAVRAFEEDGYAVLRDVIPRHQLAAVDAHLAESFERAKRSGALFSGGGNLAGHLNCSPGEVARSVYDRLVDRGVVELVRTLMPKSVRLPNVGCNFNLPGSIVQHYHADRPFTNDFMIVNVAVVDTTVVNGAIEVLPGTHKRFYPYWRFALERAVRPGVRLPLRQGDVLLRTSNLWHRGMPNRSDRPRPMLAFTWEDGGSVPADPFAADEGQTVFRPNWYHPTTLGKIRERAFIAAPITYDAFRFVRSLVSNKGYDH